MKTYDFETKSWNPFVFIISYDTSMYLYNHVCTYLRMYVRRIVSVTTLDLFNFHVVVRELKLDLPLLSLSSRFIGKTRTRYSSDDRFVKVKSSFFRFQLSKSLGSE